MFFHNGSPGQITMLDRSGSKCLQNPGIKIMRALICVNVQFENSKNSFLGHNVNLNFQVTAAATAAATSQELSQSGKSPDPSRPGTKYPVQESLTSTNSFLNAAQSCMQWLWWHQSPPNLNYKFAHIVHQKQVLPLSEVLLPHVSAASPTDCSRGQSL